MTITLDELIELKKAMQLIADTDEARKNGNLLEVIMQPTGKRLRDCTGADLQQTAEWMMRMGTRLDSLKGEAQ